MPSNNIVSINDVNYGICNPQFNHLTTIVNGLINLPVTKTLSEIAKCVLSSKDKSCIYRFLSHSKWDDSLLNANRLSHLNFFLEHNIKPYYKKKLCEELNREFKSKIHIARDFISGIIL